MEYGSLLEQVRRHLKDVGVDCQATSGRPVTLKTIAATESKLKIRLPAELREFYQTVGNGYVSFWQAEPNDYSKPFGGLQVPSLSDLAKLYTGWRKLVLYSPEQAEKYGFPYTDDPELAKRTAARMWHWLPLIEEGNGDSICIDLGDPGCPVIFHKHDWVDGGSGDDGHPLASNWRAFLIGWGSVCFQPPRSMYWPSCFRPGGIAWDSEQFLEPFRVAGLAESGNAH